MRKRPHPKSTKGRKPSKHPAHQGVISIHAKGFGFVKQTSGPDVFIPKHLTKDAVDGDLVSIQINPKVSPKGPEGEVISILKRNRTHLAATILSVSKDHCTAYSPLLGPDKLLVVRQTSSLIEGDRILCKVKNWNNDLDLIEGVLDKKLGNIADPSIDIVAAMEEFEIPKTFSPEAIQEAKRFGKKVPPEELAKRVDLTQVEIVTIDPTTARDFDDAISLTKSEKGHFLLGVHIADVAHYIPLGSPLDLEAQKRCNSTYFPGFCNPMLPEALSNELCSLKPNVVRLTQSVFAEFDLEGNLVQWEIARSAIQSAKRFTYEEAFEVLQKKKKSPFAPLLERMVELCHLLKKKRMERGSIDFSLPENVIVVDPQGSPLRIEKVEYDITHQMIEEFMLKANEIVALHLNAQGKTLIYRIHEEPSSDSFEDFYTLARSLGFSLPAKPTHKDIQKLFQSAKNTPQLSQLSISFIRSMKTAAYSPENIGHYGLALEHYCHFTSPIRRYTDLICQRLLFDEMGPNEDLQVIATGCSEKERLSFKAEVSVKTLKKLRLAERHFAQDPSQVYEAKITRIRPYILQFEVPLFDLESSFHVSEIGGDYYEYHPKAMTLKGNHTGRTFRSGDKIAVRLHRIDLTLQKTEWTLVEKHRSCEIREISPS